jgi:HNH endonuclease
MTEVKFFAIEPTIEDYWRAIILFGKNVACYKFALAKSLLKLAPQGKTVITLEELAVPYAKYVTEHLELCETQSQISKEPYPFLGACKQFNTGVISYDELLQITKREGFKVVLDKFHNVGGELLPVNFYRKCRGGIEISEDLFRLLEIEQFQNLLLEVEARWNLVETAWHLNISRNLIKINYDSIEKQLFTINQYNYNQRVSVTSCRSALNGYQKSQCFYSFSDISIIYGSDNLADVDHFFPFILNRYIDNVDGVWNLVLASQECNRGKEGKFDRLPHIEYLERLYNRNEFLITSHHPLRETLIYQTGKTDEQRRQFLQTNYNTAQAILGSRRRDGWKTVTVNSPKF